MKKFFVFMLFVFAMNILSEVYAAPTSKCHKRKCGGWGKKMLKPKNNWKSYVRYR